VEANGRKPWQDLLAHITVHVIVTIKMEHAPSDDAAHPNRRKNRETRDLPDINSN
jgi:hypothetical protein